RGPGRAYGDGGGGADPDRRGRCPSGSSGRRGPETPPPFHRLGLGPRGRRRGRGRARPPPARPFVLEGCRAPCRPRLRGRHTTRRETGRTGGGRERAAPPDRPRAGPGERRPVPLGGAGLEAGHGEGPTRLCRRPCSRPPAAGGS